jgi:hypothetical protein
MLLYYFLSRRTLASNQKSIQHFFSEASAIELLDKAADQLSHYTLLKVVIAPPEQK